MGGAEVWTNKCDKLPTMTLVYLLVIKFIVCTKPDHHAEAEPFVHYAAPDIALCRKVSGTSILQ